MPLTVCLKDQCKSHGYSYWITYCFHIHVIIFMFVLVLTYLPHNVCNTSDIDEIIVIVNKFKIFFC